MILVAGWQILSEIALLDLSVILTLRQEFNPNGVKLPVKLDSDRQPTILKQKVNRNEERVNVHNACKHFNLFGIRPFS